MFLLFTGKMVLSEVTAAAAKVGIFGGLSSLAKTANIADKTIKAVKKCTTAIKSRNEGGKT